MEEQKLPQIAQTEFNNHNYSASLNALNQLQAIKPNDTKVNMNKAVVEFYSSGHKNVDLFQKHINHLCSINRININESEVPEDVELCIIYYNQAIIYFLQKQYETALTIMENVFNLIQPMEESLAHKVCLFLVELHLCLNQTDKALERISFIETQFISRDNHISKLEKDSNDKAAVYDSATDEFRIKLYQYRARCNLIKQAYDLSQKDLDLIRAAGKQNYTTVMMSAQIEFNKRNHEKANQILIVLQEDIKTFCALDETKKFIYYNNMGSLYHYLCKPALAKYFLNVKGTSVCSKALEKFSRQGSRDSAYGRPAVFQPEVVAKYKYNVGVSLLFAGMPNEAFEYLTEASQVMHTSPLVWLRLAECCICVHNPGNDDHFDFQRKRRELVVGAVGTGPNKRIILNTEIYNNSAYSTEPQSYAIPAPNLDFALLCMRNAQRLLPKGYSKLKMAVYVTSAYINLTIGNPVEALRDCMAIVDEESNSLLYKYLARMYMAESLLMLDRIQEAINVLNPSHYKDFDPVHERLLSPWCPNNKLCAETILQYNLAVALTIRGDLDKASELLKRFFQIWLSRGPKSEIPIQVVSLALYIELVLDRIEIARTIVRRNCPHIFS